VIVVPPDYEPASSSGPVVVTSNLRDDAVEAVRFAAAMSERLGRPLVVIHVVPYPDDYGAHYIPEASRRKIAADNQREGEQGLHEWLVANKVTAAEEIVVQGGVVERILETVDDRQASLLVTGSRVLSMLERVLLTSIGSELAANGPCPVAVVPPALE
jgi:nucleotide-binding universal stress UspA family protein